MMHGQKNIKLLISKFIIRDFDIMVTVPLLKDCTTKRRLYSDFRRFLH